MRREGSNARRVCHRSYDESAAFGQQVRSQMKSAGSYSFGFSERHDAQTNYKKTMYMGKDFDRGNFGVHSPGPCMYNKKSTIGDGGSSGMSKYRNTPSFSFGTEDRFMY